MSKTIALTHKPLPSGFKHYRFSQSLPLTTNSYALLQSLDENLVGTPDYLGIAFFWNYEYRHSLRGASAGVRKTVHDKLLATGLALNGSSDQHKKIIDKACR